MKRPGIVPRALVWLCVPSHLREVIAGDLEEQWHAAGRRGYWGMAVRSIGDCWRGTLHARLSQRDAQPARPWTAVDADLRFTVRLMARSPGFALAAVLTLALGIGGSTAIFSVVKPALFEPLPYPDSDRIVSICDRGQDGSCVDVAFGTFREILARSHSFESLAVARPWQPVLTGAGEPQRLDGQRVSADYFDVLGVHPARGRSLTEGDDRPGVSRVAIVSDGLWRRRFNGDPGLIGREITLGDLKYAVVGILPRGFENVSAPTAEVWTALQYDPALPVDGREWGHHLRMTARLRPGGTVNGARDDLSAIARAPVADMPRVPWASMATGFLVNRLQDELTRDLRPLLLAFSAAVALVLTIASANVANLLLGRALQRRREFAVRAALGAGRARLARQIVIEGLVIATLGGVLGAIAARIGVDTLTSLRPAGLVRLDAIAVDRPSLFFALAVSLLVGIGIAVLPALQTIRGDLQPSLQHGSRSTTSGPRNIRQVLVVAEVALALVLLVSAGLLFRSLRELVSISPGFVAEGVTVAQVQAVGARFRDSAVALRFFDGVAAAVAAIPGVTHVGQTNQLPLSGDLQRYGVHAEYAPAQDPSLDRSAYRYAVTPEYFDTMEIPLRRGRLLQRTDRAGTPNVVVISESLAARRFAGIDPIGQRLRVGGEETPLLTIVGIVGDVKQSSLGVNDADAVYLTAEQSPFSESVMWTVVRSDSRRDLAPALRSAVWSVDKDQPVVRMTALSALVSNATADRRFALFVFGVFGVVALVLAITGLYSALARSVTERTREIGVRAALGASRSGILVMILRQGLALTAVGVVAGIAGALLVTRLLEVLLFGTTPTDPLTYLAAALLFTAVAAMASTVPALRAVAIDPAITLRAE
jgi:putative ABC transport system permease protein